MPPVHEFQDAVIEGLYAHADTVDPKIKQSLYKIRALVNNIFRIDLNSKLIVWSSMADITQCFQKTFINIKGQHRWGAASYV